MCQLSARNTILENGSSTYKKTGRSKEEIIDENQEYSERLGYSLSEKEKDLPAMYWIPKMHKNPIKHRFIVASRTAQNQFQNQCLVHLS